jgi:hypothetical protein
MPGVDGRDFAINRSISINNWNEFESIYEWVAEEVLQIKNAVPEQITNNANQHGILKKYAPAYVAVFLQKQHLLHTGEYNVTLHQYETVSGKPLAGFITLFSPPPNAA